MSAAAAAPAPAAAAAADGPTEEEKAEGIAEVGWRLPAQWSDSTWRTSAGDSTDFLPCALRVRAIVRLTAKLLLVLLVLWCTTDDAEVLHRQRNPVTQTFEYYVHYVECAQPAAQLWLDECLRRGRCAIADMVGFSDCWRARREQLTDGWTSGSRRNGSILSRRRSQTQKPRKRR